MRVPALPKTLAVKLTVSGYYSPSDDIPLLDARLRAVNAWLRFCWSGVDLRAVGAEWPA